MAEPALVADCIAAMNSVVKTPVTVKTRIGIDDKDSYEELTHFIRTVAATGCTTFIIHARKAWLNGLSPKENREIPPLKYDVAYQLKKDFPALEIIVNGGITAWPDIHTHLQHVDGVMLGREAYHNPYVMAPVDTQLYGEMHAPKSRHAVMQAFVDYAEQQMAQGEGLQHLSRHILGLFQGLPGARQFRRHISENAHRKGASSDVLKHALRLVHEHPV
jgi:tRNA-dihydrouridine synthase A